MISGNNAINNAFGGYDDAYFGGLEKSYKDYYMPQLEDQYSNAKDQSLFNAARAGIINSSAAAKTNADLEKSRGTQEQAVISGAQNYANSARSQIGNQRSALQGQLQASGGNYVDTSGLSQISAPALNPLTPLGDLFSNVAGVASNDSLVRARQAGTNSILNPSGQKKSQIDASVFIG